MSESLSRIESGSEANRIAYEGLSSLVTGRLKQIPTVKDRLLAVKFSLGDDDLPYLRGRHRVHNISFSRGEAAFALRVAIDNPAYGASSVFDLYPNGDLDLLPGEDVWDDRLERFVPRTQTSLHLEPGSLISGVDTYLPVLKGLPAIAEIELPARID